MKTRSKVLVVAFVLCGLSIGAMSDFHIRWRVQFVATKLVGRAPYMSWREVASVLRSSGVRSPPSRPGSTKALDPASTAADSGARVQEGRELFRHQCSQCHGGDAKGGSGPDLTQGEFQHGGSDSALSHTIAQGVAGTAMQAHSLSGHEVGAIIAFLRSAIAASASRQRFAAETPFSVSFGQLLSAASDSADWLLYSGSYDGRRHSRLSQIKPENISHLHVKWMFQVPKDSKGAVITTPLVVGDAMFVTLPPSDVRALDARTGRQIWSWSAPEPPIVKAAYVTNRGLAIYGNSLYLGTMGAHLVSLNAQTGELLWDVKVADPRDGYSITSPPLVIRDRVIVGVAGGEHGVRGLLDAYSAKTGERLWRFYTVPGPGEPGHETWGQGDAWRRGGAPTWVTGSYDPALDLVYWGVGNPAPPYLGDVRPGANLYSNSVVALDVATGRLRWHFQFTPHDEHGWDAAQVPVLADAVFNGTPRKLMFWANRNAFYYVLDRETGQFLQARAFGEQTWALGIDSAGVPIERAGSRPTPEPKIISPPPSGATNWWSPSYDSASGTMFVPTMAGAGVFTKGAPIALPDGSFPGSTGIEEPDEPRRTSVRALDALTGALRWEYRFPPRGTLPIMGGVLSTDGGLVLAGDRGRLVGLDARNGHELWHFNVGADINAAPMTYLSEGRQQVTLAAGRLILTFSLDGQ